MVESVVDLLIGRGHPVRRVRHVGLSDASDAVIAEYALAQNLVIVTFDRDLRDTSIRQGARCLHIHQRETTARRRLAAAYDAVIQCLWQGYQLVSLTSQGEAVAAPPRPGPAG